MNDTAPRHRDRLINFVSFRVLPASLFSFLALSAGALPYNAVQLNFETTANQRLTLGGTAWGDMDGDGDLDLVVSGQDVGGNYQLRVYANGGPAAYAINATQTEVLGLNNGWAFGGIALGDLDGDGDLDVVVTGSRNTAASRIIAVARNNGALAFTQLTVDAGSGLQDGSPALGDFDNDGDLDLAAAGLDPAGQRQLRVYRNNGDATFNANQIEVNGAANNGYAANARVAWADYNNDGDLDLVVEGQNGAGRQVHLYRNLGSGAFNATAVDVTAGGGGLSDGDVAWGDLNGDALLDVVAMGFDGTNSQLRVYRNNGNDTFTTFNVPGAANLGIRNGGLAVGDSNNDGVLDIAVVGLRPATGLVEVWLYRNNGGFGFTQFNVESAGNLGLQNGDLAWADYNGNNGIDLLVSGIDNAALRQMSVYQNNVTTAVAPGATAVLASTFVFSATGVSTATFKWNPAADAGAGATAAALLDYDLEVSTLATFARKVIPHVSTATPRRGNYSRPPLIYDGNSRHGVYLVSTAPWNAALAHPGLRTDTTYYYRVYTVDAGLLNSAPSAAATLWTGVAPNAVTLTAGAGASDGIVNLTWTSPGDDQNRGNLVGNYILQYSSNAATVWNPTSTPAGAYTLNFATSIAPGVAQSTSVTVFDNGTWYFVLWSRDDVGLYSAISNTASATPPALHFSPLQIEVDGVGGGLQNGGVSFGDFDNDGDMDILASGVSAGTNYQLRVYINNGDSTFNSAQIEVDALNGGLYTGGVDWGDFDGDGDLDILASGITTGGAAANSQLRVYRNNGGGTFDANQIEVDGLNGGLNAGDVKWGDADNDGDLDILCAGLDAANARQLRVYLNNGNGTFNANQIEIDGAAGGLQDGIVDWGDIDGDGDQDILAQGWNGGGTSSEIRVYRNNGNGTFDPNQIDVDPAAGIDGYNGKHSAHFGDFDADGDLDILVEGVLGGLTANRELRVYRNNGNGTFDPAQIEVNGVDGGNSRGGAQWGDIDNDGDLDILVHGLTGTTAGGVPETRAYINAGGGAFTRVEVEPTAADDLSLGGLAVGDYDADGDIDFVVSGVDSGGGNQLRVYRNLSTVANVAPNPPTILKTSFVFQRVGTSTGTFMWNEGVDNAPGATPEAGLSYYVEIATKTSFVPLVQSGPFDPPKTYDGGTKYGMVLNSTEPWNSLSTNYGLRTDTTYYFHVKTIDAGLMESAYTALAVATSTLWTGVGPATSTLGAVTGASPGLVTLSWSAAGDDAIYNNLVGNFRIQYSTIAATVWSTATTPSGAITLTIATTAVAGTSQVYPLSLPTNDLYYLVLWSQDDVGEWSNISNTTSATPALINRSVTVTAGDPYLFGSLAVGSSSHTATAVTIQNDGNIASTYSLSAATTTAGSPWSIGNALPTSGDVVVVSGGFHGSRPALGAFGPEDVITGTSAPSSATQFSINGSVTGVSVPVAAARDIWFRLDMPTTSATESPQDITVTITAGP
ncbi:MAG: VCBS repeat-containing protein [Elusimicrobia bacterium]|nr:VCBS repeat-containing protein [Elusimicrobiota bacterium]